VALLEPFTLALAEDADRLNTLQQLGIVNRLNTATRRYTDWFKQHDVILCPVLLSASIRSGSIDQTKPYETLVAELTDLVGYTPLMNTAGAPAMSIPLNWTEAGLPVGVQFAAKPGDDANLLGLALELEAAKPWAGRRPPIWFGA
jgi:amidase